MEAGEDRAIRETCRTRSVRVTEEATATVTVTEREKSIGVTETVTQGGKLIGVMETCTSETRREVTELTETREIEP